MLTRAAFLAAAAAAGVVALAAPALAGGGGGWVACSGSACVLSAASPGSTARAAAPHGGAAGDFAAPGCAAGGMAQACALLTRAGPGPRAGLPAAASLAREAESRLAAGSPVIRVSPAPGALLVHVPAWLWLAGPWAAVTATAAVPGEKVTATAVPVRVTWQAGDGAVVTCDGPGTAYRPGGDPAAASPTCGHVYAVTSAGAPGGTFTLRASITWAVTWSGGGTAGSLGGLVTAAAVRVTVGQSQAIVTGTRS